MSGKVKIRLGDIFDHPSDLLVLPCSTTGTVTLLVEQALRHYQLPRPPSTLRLGDVQFMRFGEAENVANFLAFAASVQGGTSSVEAIKRVGIQLGQFTRMDTGVQTIASPLLGAGTGGLESEVVVNSLRDGFTSTASSKATLIIHVRHPDLYERLRRLVPSVELVDYISNRNVLPMEQQYERSKRSEQALELKGNLSTNNASPVERQSDKPLTEQKLPVRNQVFISYSHTDARWLSRLQVHIKPLERDNLIKRWDDTLIKPGTKWREQIRSAIESAKVAVLLISAEFLASDFIVTNELPPLLAAAESEGAVILPIIISPCLFLQTKTLAQFQSVNPPSKPLAGMRKINQDQVFVKVAETIVDALSS